MTDVEILALLGSGAPIDNARQLFSSWSARLEQAGQQYRPIPAIEMRRMEFEAVKEIARALEGKE
jgi:hypothetical protein